ncbi:hypothetical protein EDC01DRAFT_653233 [Geopyxis carbonaria]|nr:hypothetical protein EDC01DRAFT_653233 [Geopyxis carbonaria]
MTTISPIGMAVAISILFSATSMLCFVRFYLDIYRSLNHIRYRSNLASIFTFTLGWMLLCVTAGCYFWTLDRKLDIEVRHKVPVFYVASAGVDFPDVEMSLILSNVVAGFSGVTGLWAVKTSFFFMSLNLQPQPLPRVKVAIFAVGIYLFISWFASILIAGFWCKPFSQLWKVTDSVLRGDPICSPFIDPSAIAIETALNTSSTISIMILPIFLLLPKSSLTNYEKTGFWIRPHKYKSFNTHHCRAFGISRAFYCTFGSGFGICV